MGTFFAYAIQSAICLVFFYLFYKLLLSRETFHRFNRMALLGILLLSFTIPALLTLFPIQQVTPMLPVISEFVDELSITGKSDKYLAGVANNETGSVLLALCLIVYLAGCAICLIYTALSTLRIIRIINRGTNSRSHNGTKLIILHDQTIPPFSWMKYIVCSKSDYEEAGETIITHEQTHIQLHHSLDLIIAQAGVIMQWFNPAVWLLYSELQNIHEYEADDAVIRKGINARQYQLLLIKKTVGTRLYAMANSFNHNNLKKRITMMYQKKSNPYARLKYAYVLPLAATAVALFAQPEISQPFDEISNAKISHFSFVTNENEVKKLPEVEFSVTPELPEVTVRKHALIVANDTTIYETVEKMPQFPGGEFALMRWISDNLNYPVEAQKNGIQGRVFCQFVIEKDGAVTNVEVKRAVNHLLDAEAARVLKTLPKFVPGENGGQCVRVRFSVPVRFQLQGSTDMKSKDTQITVDSVYVNGAWYYRKIK